MTARWYIVHAYSNFEKKVAEDIENKAKQKGLSADIEQIVVPTEKVVEIRRGRKVDAERKFFPGYVLVKANLTDAVFSLVKNTPKVTGFLGDSKPVPITDKPRPSASCTRCRKASSGRSRRSPSRSASRCASRTVRSPRSTASSRKSTRSGRGSRWKFRSSGAPCPSISNSDRSKRADPKSLPPIRRLAGGGVGNRGSKRVGGERGFSRPREPHHQTATAGFPDWGRHETKAGRDG